MKKITTVLMCCMAILNSNGLLAQSGYSSYPQGNSYSSPPSSSNYTSNTYAFNRINWLSNYSEAVSLSQATSKPIVILFTGTNWCPACMKLERTVLNHPEFTQAVSQRFVFLKAEFPDYSESVMNSPYKPLLDRYGINEFPTIVVVNADGQMLYTVKYREGGPQVYSQELLQKLNQKSSSYPSSSTYNY